MSMQSYCIFSFCIFFTLLTNSSGILLVIVNKCKQSIWPGILGTAGHESPMNGGFSLYSGEEVVVNIPDKWSGRVWARQGCCFDQHGKGSCQTGDCGGGLLHCMGTGGQPPATVVEMTFGTPQNPLHYYDVTLVDGFNLPVSMVPVVPHGGCGCGCGCEAADCEADLNSCCPESLAIQRAGKVVGCKSLCLATKNPKDCCTGEYANPGNCKPTIYANMFKALCPRAYSYAFDEPTGLKRCNASRYVITFCPTKA